MACRIGIDTGGTHTDLVLVDEDRDEVLTLKVPTTPHDHSVGVMEGVARILDDAGLKAEDVHHLAYGTTVVTNQLIQRNDDTRIALIATDGFRDVIEIQRGSRLKNIFDVAWKPLVPLVPRRLRFNVRERVAANGDIVLPLDEAQLRFICGKLNGSGVEGIVISFVNAYVNPANEQRAAEIAREACPGIAVTASTDVSRQFREFERTSTATINAYVQKPMEAHLQGLSVSLRDMGVPASPYIMRANGGLMTFDAAARLPVSITHSGPTAGIMAGVAIGQVTGIDHLITFDMGGTSSDVSLIRNGKPLLTNKGNIEGWPVILPMLDLVTVGAGGGTKARLDAAGSLKVGPFSAGAVPGPVCYDTGGTEPTITDCNLVLGRLDASSLLGGTRRLRIDLAEKAIKEKVADGLGLGVDEAALAILAIVESHMVDAVKQISVRRGLDPRDFQLVGFGGAGPLHALNLAHQLEIDNVLIPPAPGNFSALGQLAGDIQHDIATTRVGELSADHLTDLNSELERMVEEGTKLLVDDGVDPGDRVHIGSLDLCYWGQNHEINVPVALPMTAESIAATVATFHSEHLASFGFADTDKPVKCVNLRVSAIGRMPELRLKRYGDPKQVAPEPASRRNVITADGKSVALPVYSFDALAPGARIAGAAIVEYAGSTLFVPSDWAVAFDEYKIAHARRQG